MALAAAMLAVAFSARAAAETRCEHILKAFGDRLIQPVCFESEDLTTANERPGQLTTPPDNTLKDQKGVLLPTGAWTPRTDRTVIAPDAANKTPITKAVPGLQIQAWIASDTQGQARFLLRLPNDWNGRLVVAGASGTRSEFNGDFAWSDYVVQKGYAYASQNKGVLNLFFTTAADPLGCRLNPFTEFYVHFYDNDPGQQFTRWASFMAQAAMLARRGVESHYGREARHTYAVGTSNGGYQTRRAVELFPSLFDGGVDWEGTYVDAGAPNLLTDLPPAILNFPDYEASGRNPDGTPAKNIRLAGYPPDIAGTPLSLWGRYNAQFWEVTQCQWQKRLDPSYDTYKSGTGTYNYIARLSVSDVGSQLAAFATTGSIRRPLVTVAGTMDGLLPIDHHARAYARKVAAAQAEHGDEDGNEKPAYRLYEVQNGNHIETYKSSFFPQLEFIEPHAQKAFDLLVGFVEKREPLPASQCIGRGGEIKATPAQPGHCKNLFEP
jgi:hypothetical protein